VKIGLLPSYSKIIVASEYALEREAIIKLLTSEKEFEIIAQASSANDIKEILNSAISGDILILDADMSSLDIFEIMKLIKEKSPCLKVLLLTSKYDPERIMGAIFAGCLGYISKNASATELAKSVRALTRSEVWIERKLMSKVILRMSDFYFNTLSSRH
jgi:DNA-binding NarL/FixJ family response regulator